VSVTAQTGRLTAFALRLDRRTSAVWACSIGAITVFVALAFERLYPTEASRHQLAVSADSPVLRAILGPLLDPTSIGGLVAWREGAVLAIVLGLATTFLVVRHTRGEEQHGRGALVFANPVGRGAPAVAALAAAAVLDAAAAVAVCLGLLVFAQPVGGAALLGATVGLTAWWFGCVAALLAQVASTSRGANGAAASVVALAFLLRAIGELKAHGLVWASPFGWIGAARPFAGGRAWVLLLPLLTGALVAGAAVVLAARREVGRGLLPERRRASSAVGATPAALAWRLERVTVATTATAAAVYAVAIGSMISLVKEFAGSSPSFQQVIEQLGGTHAIEDAFGTTMAVFGAIAIGAWAVSLVLRLHVEEEHGRATFLVASGAPRTEVFDAFGGVATVAGALALLWYGVGLGAGRLIGEHHWASFGRGVLAAVVALPAMLVVIAVALLAVGLSARTAWLAWSGIVWCAVIAFTATIGGLPQWLRDLSPFTHVPGVPLRARWWLGCLVLVAIAVALTAAARVAYRRRALGGP
jgi:ABC-2 type transport system permease protein